MKVARSEVFEEVRYCLECPKCGDVMEMYDCPEEEEEYPCSCGEIIEIE